MAAGSPLVVCDFDGTLAEVDVGNALCEAHAAPGWHAHIDAYRRGELSLPEAQRRAWAMVAASPDVLLADARALGRLRAGAAGLFDAARSGRCRLVVASGGFDFYVRPLIGAAAEACEAVLCNELAVGGEGPVLRFPHGDVACDSHAVCKREVIRLHRRAGARVLFCGDGTSDRCVIDTDAELFVVTGSHLEGLCREQGRPHTPFDDFATVLESLRGGATACASSPVYPQPERGWGPRGGED